MHKKQLDDNFYFGSLIDSNSENTKYSDEFDPTYESFMIGLDLKFGRVDAYKNEYPCKLDDFFASLELCYDRLNRYDVAKGDGCENAMFENLFWADFVLSALESRFRQKIISNLRKKIDEKVEQYGSDNFLIEKVRKEEELRKHISDADPNLIYLL